MNAQSTRRICPRHQVIVVQPSPVELEAELAPLEFSIPGFQSRIPPLTLEELHSMDLVRSAAAGHGGVKS
jgi:hypothetical protein